MKLKDLINQYQATGYVLQTKGSGSTDPMWIDYLEAIEIDASLAGTEMHAVSCDECDHNDMGDFRRAIEDENTLIAYVSDWLDLGNGSDNQYRILF